MNITIRLPMIVISTLLVGCSQLYKAGNLVVLNYQIETNLRTDLVMKYMDTLVLNYGYGVPEKWRTLDKLVDLDSISNKRLYFKSSPEEMYLISEPAGLLFLSDIYNENIHADDWVSERDSLPEKEKTRAMLRFKSEVLDVVEGMAKRDGVPDTLIYKR